MRLIGPMQSWGTISRFHHRDTCKEPSKSGVIGLLAAAMGIDRENWDDLKPLASLSMAVRHDRSGLLKCDFQTIACAQNDKIIKACGKTEFKNGVVSKRDYLADASFLIGLESENNYLLNCIQMALQNPVWPIFLGRKSYVASEMVWFKEGLQEEGSHEVISKWPWICTLRRGEVLPEKLIISFDSKDDSGTIKMDQPLSSFSDRRFGARLVKSDWIPFPQEVSYVAT